MIVRVVLATFAVWASLNGIASAQVKLRLIQPYPAGTPIDLGATALVSSLEKRLSGTATIELIRVQMPAQEVAGILATGQADMGLLPSTFIASTTSSSLSLFDLPFLFKTLSEVAAVQDRYVGEALLSSVGPNMVGISYWNGGMTNVFGRVLSKPSDLREAKLFTTVSREGALAAEALGAATSRLAQGEAIAAFRSGALNTAELSPTAALRLAIAPTYISDESYRPLVSVLVSSERSWNQLPFRVQTVLATEARNVAASVTSEAVRQDAVANRALSEKGFKLVRMEVTSPDEVERAWRSVPSVESTGYLNATLPLLKELRETPPNRQRGDTSPGPGVREILFATDRVDEGGNDPALRFGSARGPLRYGVARFALDPSRRVAGPGLGTSLAS